MNKETRKKLEEILYDLENEDIEYVPLSIEIINSIIENFKDEKPIINIFIGDDLDV